MDPYLTMTLIKNRKTIIRIVTAVTVLILGIFFLFSDTSSFKNDETGTGEAIVSPDVLKWKSAIEKEAKANEIPEKVNTLMAIMMVESGGRGSDVMQSSESLGLPVNSLSPAESIKQGVKYYASLLRSARDKGCDEDSALASYNFGGGYLNYVEKNGKKHTLKIAESFSRDVVAPSLGNTSGTKYDYPNPIANGNGNYLYLNGGNFYYVDLVKEYLAPVNTGSSGTSSASTAVLDTVMGQHVNNGECYGLTAFYVEKLGGPQLMGSGFMSAANIGIDYDWAKYGWQVIFNPKFTDLRAGDVINWSQGELANSIYGHTGIIKSVDVGKKMIVTYEQNAGQGRICAIYVRNWSSSITSIVRKK